MPKASNSDIILPSCDTRLQRVRSGFIQRSNNQRHHGHLGHHDRYTWTHQQYETMAPPPVYQLASDHALSCTVKVAPARRQTSSTVNGSMKSEMRDRLQIPPTDFASTYSKTSSVRKLVLPSNSANVDTLNLSDSALKRDFSISNNSVSHSTPVRAGRNLVRNRKESSCKNNENVNKDKQQKINLGCTTKPSRPSLFNTRDLCYILMLSLLTLGIANIYFYQLLDTHFVLFDIDKLNNSLQQDVFGQHIATAFIPLAIKEYLNDENNTRPLVLSFHGWTGVGKTHVANIFVNNLAAKRRITNVRIILPMHTAQLANITVASQINALFTSTLYYHTLNLFIVDDIDKMSSAFVDGLQNLLFSLNATTYGNDTKIIVLLLSNSGSAEINKYVINHLKAGYTRESIQHADIVLSMWQNASEQWYAKWQNSTTLHWVIPFLPLQSTHLCSCMQRYLATRNITISDEITERVLKQINFFPAESPMFSTTGCRQVAEKANIELDLNDTNSQV